MAILDEAETDVANSDAFAWGRVIPRDFLDEFPRIDSLSGQIYALKTTLQSLLDQAGAQNQQNRPENQPQNGPDIIPPNETTHGSHYLPGL